MNKTVSTIVLVVLGILLSAKIMSSPGNSEAITLNENNHVLFSGPVGDKSVAEAQIKLGKLSKNLGPNETIYLVIDSPGGSISAGNLFIDFAKSLPQKIKPICIFCASMGYHMFQSFDERIVYSNSTLMSHRASLGGLSGQIPGELDTRLASIYETLNQMDSKVAQRVGLSTEAYRKLIYDELWLNGASAVKTKHADRIAKIKCDPKIVDQTRNETVFLPIFGPVEVTYSKCPLINGILGARLSREVPGKTEADLFTEIKRTYRTVVKLEM